MQAVGEPAYLQSANVHLKRRSECFFICIDTEDIKVSR